MTLSFAAASSLSLALDATGEALDADEPGIAETNRPRHKTAALSPTTAINRMVIKR